MPAFWLWADDDLFTDGGKLAKELKAVIKRVASQEPGPKKPIPEDDVWVYIIGVPFGENVTVMWNYHTKEGRDADWETRVSNAAAPAIREVFLKHGAPKNIRVGVDGEPLDPARGGLAE